MGFKGTKGKWEIGEIDKTKAWSDSPKTCVAWSTNKAQNRGFYVNKDLEEMKANALLISKAPEMLEMLNRVRLGEFPEEEIKQLIEEAAKNLAQLRDKIAEAGKLLNAKSYNMKGLKELHAQIKDKKTFNKNLSEKLFLSKVTVENAFKTGGKFKSKHLTIVKYWLNVELELQQKALEMWVKDWAIVK